MKSPRVFKACLALALVMAFSPAHASGGSFLAALPMAAKYKNVVAVAKSGAPFSSIGAALASISDASSDNRYLVAVAAGVYAENIQLKEWVHVCGAGRGATVITAPGGDTPNTATVTGADNSRLSNLSVVNTGGGDYALGIYNTGASPRLHDLDISVTNNTGSITAGIYNSSDASPEISDLNISVIASGTVSETRGLYNFSNSNPVVRNTALTVSSSSSSGGAFGVQNLVNCAPQMTGLDVSVSSDNSTDLAGVTNINNSPARICQSLIKVSGNCTTAKGVQNLSSAAYVADSSIQVTSDSGDSRFGVFSDSSDGVVLRNLNILVAAATSTSNAGVLSRDCSPTLDNLALDVSGASVNDVGVSNNSASPAMYYCSILVDQPGGGTGLGIYNQNTSRPTIFFCDVRGGHFGIMNSTGSSSADSMKVIKSNIKGATQAVVNGSDYTLFMTSNILDGGVTDSGAATCADCYDQQGNAVTCP